MAVDKAAHILTHTRMEKGCLEALLSAADSNRNIELDQTDDDARTLHGIENDTHDAYCLEINRLTYTLISRIGETPQLNWPQLLLFGHGDSLDKALHDIWIKFANRDIEEHFMDANALYASLHAQYHITFLSRAMHDRPAIRQMDFERALRDVENNADQDRTHPLIAFLDAGQISDMALSMWTRADDIANYQQKQGDLSFDTDKKRCERWASLLMKRAYEKSPAGHTSGKVPFQTQVTQGGGIRFRDVFVQLRNKDDAEFLAGIYAKLNGADFGLHVPEPEPYTKKYPLIQVGEKDAALITKFVHGQTVREFLREEGPPDDFKTDDPALSYVAEVYREMRRRLLPKLLHDLALYEHIAPKVVPMDDVMENDEACVDRLYQTSIGRTSDALCHLLARIPNTCADYSDAIKAADGRYTFVPVRGFGNRRAINFGTMFMTLHRDCSPSNVILKHASLSDGESLPDASIVKHLTGDTKLHRRESRPFEGIVENTACDEPESLMIERMLENQTTHIDFGQRLALRGEDFYQLMLDPDWPWYKTKGAEWDKAVLDAMECGLYHYLIYETMIGKEGRGVFVDYDLATRKEGRTLLLAQTENKPIPPGTKFPMNTGIYLLNTTLGDAAFTGEHGLNNDWRLKGKEVRDYLLANNGFDIDKHAYHLDWMWYCRAMREADIALTVLSKNTAKELIAPMVRHFVRCGTLPLERMRKRFQQEMVKHDIRIPGYESFVPVERLDTTKTFALLHDLPEPQRNARSIAERHMMRLDYLAALSQHLLAHLPAP
jgi:hypothetical protein